MISRILIILSLIVIVLFLVPLVEDIQDSTKLTPLAEKYVQEGVSDLGAANLVTAVVVSYRGLDTLGEVSVLFAATAGVVLLLGWGDRRKSKKKERREGSELLQTGSLFLFPLILLFGVYIFAHGHLTPGGGFQGGVVIASGVLLLILSLSDRELNHKVLTALEALSGAAYVAVGLLGLWLAAGFLDPRFIPSGQMGELFSAGAIPVIYSLVGLKVGAELTGIIDAMRRPVK
jgi:multicomponent Na+:H+ antiporter subunit B